MSSISSRNSSKVPSLFIDQTKFASTCIGHLKPGGHAYYQLPTPQTCKVARDHPGYIAPDGFLQSKFITPFAEQNLRCARNSVLHPSLDPKHPPQGLYTLILTAVECGFTAHIKIT
ncbi:hypothetical protein L208DRAFT_894943 [Tricholoma matsutake]|nr:hypothetical protein L208DRAFT_894943 [Tricholoma matsutake 945]